MAWASDTFNTGSDGAYIVGNAPVVGGNWTDGSEASSPSPIYSGNRARQKDTATSFTYVATTPSSADYWVQADVTPQSGGSGGVAGVCARKVAGTGAGNLTCYWADYYDHATAGSRQWRLVKYVSGTATVLGTYTENIGTTTKTLRLSCVGTAIKAYVDDVERISATDSSVTAAGRAGMIFGAASSPSTNAVYLDNWLATDPYTTNTRTFTADAVVVAANTQTFTADAVVYDPSVTRTFTADAIVEAPVWYDADATTYGTQTFTADAIVAAGSASTVTRTFTADAIVLAQNTRTFTADAIVATAAAAISRTTIRDTSAPLRPYGGTTTATFAATTTDATFDTETDLP